jgi:hypothetical protein
MNKCPITGGTCHCETKLAVSPLGVALLLDLKATLRKIITDQTWYLSFLICESLLVLRPSHMAVLNRLLQTTKELRELLEPIIGTVIAELLTLHLNDHLRLINSLLEPARDVSSEKAANKKIAEIREQLSIHRELVSTQLGKLNSNKLSLDHAHELMRIYDDLAYELIAFRRNGNYDAYNKSLDRLTKHGLVIADAIYESLTL